jgi:phosphoglycolate phosphatase
MNFEYRQALNRLVAGLLTAMKSKAIIFDLDGTLLDTLEDIADSVNQVLTAKNFAPHETDEYRAFIGDGSKMLVARALPSEHRDEKMIADCLAEFFRQYYDNYDKKSTIYDGVSELLDELSRLEIKTAVLSNKRHDLTIKCIKHFFRKWHFDAIFGLRDFVPKKPHPAGALEIASILAVSPHKIKYLGDSGTDMQTALAAEMFPVGVLWGMRSGKELLECGAKALIDHPLDVLPLL